MRVLRTEGEGGVSDGGVWVRRCPICGVYFTGNRCPNCGWRAPESPEGGG